MRAVAKVPRMTPDAAMAVRSEGRSMIHIMTAVPNGSPDTLVNLINEAINA